MLDEHTISIWCPELAAAELRSRLSIAHGVLPAPPAPHGGVVFEDGAFLPSGRWRDPTDAEFALIGRSNRAPAFHHTLGIVRCPEALVDRARMVFAGRESGDLRPEAVIKMREALAHDIAVWIDSATGWRTDGPVIDLSIFHNDPGKPTVSFDPHTGLHVGLHIDSFDRFPDYLRHQASNRFCINLGTEDRYLLFVSLDAIGLLGALARVAEPEPVAPRLATRYLTTHPDTPVWRMRIKREEAYIAPTENMIHDGSSQPMHARDIHCTLRGYFLPKSSRSRRVERRELSVRTRRADGSLKLVDLDLPRDSSATHCATPVTMLGSSGRTGEGSPWLRTGAAERFALPYSLIKVDNAIETDLASTLYGWLASLDAWSEHPEPYYAVSALELAALDVPTGLSRLFAPEALSQLRAQLGVLFGCQLAERMRVVGHRMVEGQGVGIHSDDPRGVEETHRMVITLGQDASPLRGGLFAVFDGQSPSRFVRAFAPVHNHCLLFEADAHSYHAITEVRYGPRYSVVLSFWGEQDQVAG